MKTYYILKLDAYNQPSGEIIEKKLTKKEYEQLENSNCYIFADYLSALYRALD